MFKPPSHPFAIPTHCNRHAHLSRHCPHPSALVFPAHTRPVRSAWLTLPHLQVLDGGADVAHVPGLLEAREGAGGGGTGTSGTVLTVRLGTVGHGTALEAPALDATCKARAQAAVGRVLSASELVAWSAKKSTAGMEKAWCGEERSSAAG